MGKNNPAINVVIKILGKSWFQLHLCLVSFTPHLFNYPLLKPKQTLQPIPTMHTSNLTNCMMHTIKTHHTQNHKITHTQLPSYRPIQPNTKQLMCKLLSQISSSISSSSSNDSIPSTRNNTYTNQILSFSNLFQTQISPSQSNPSHQSRSKTQNQ